MSGISLSQSKCESRINEKYPNPIYYLYLISGIPEILPEGVEYPAIIPDSKHAIWRGDPVGVGLL